MIIVEGCDNSGKTVLTERLTQDLKLVLIRCRRLPKSREDVFRFSHHVEVMARHFPVILDRHPAISEPIYGPICRQKHLLNPGDQEQILTRAEKPLIIYCRPDPGVIIDFGERAQMAGVKENVHTLIRVYDSYMSQLAEDFTIVWYDWRSNMYPQLRDIVATHLELT